MAKKSTTPIYQVKVTLEESKPPIWRRILVPGDATLARLHTIIQIAMGWSDSHLHQFIVGRTFYGEPHPDYGNEMRDERRVRLNQVVPEPGMRFRYEYDFGDSWMHTLLVEKILEPGPGQRYPVCVKGERACPPEDVGGVWGYEDFLEAIGDPDHPEHEEYLEWAGDDFDAEAFDLQETNDLLREWG
ncbi:MAG: plasmid pRiA4b ORF-3 family protein [Anaerolineae bacterium]|nr:plasmid pRiA4b ORF-3 family protein [Anaerolineae bacterium]